MFSSSRLPLLPAYWLVKYTTFTQNIFSSLNRKVVLCISLLTLKGVKMGIFGLKKKGMYADMFCETS